MNYVCSTFYTVPRTGQMSESIWYPFPLKEKFPSISMKFCIISQVSGKIPLQRTHIYIHLDICPVQVSQGKQAPLVLLMAHF
jgi:hypothetical protein